jgi:hypothetical protein
MGASRGACPEGSFASVRLRADRFRSSQQAGIIRLRRNVSKVSLTDIHCDSRGVHSRSPWPPVACDQRLRRYSANPYSGFFQLYSMDESWSDRDRPAQAAHSKTRHASPGGAPCNPVTAPGKMTPAGRQQEKQRSIAAVLGRWSGTFKPAHNRAALAITDPPFPPGRASLSNHDVQHGPIPPLYR